VYDNQLHNLIASKINNRTDVPGCRASIISVTTADCLEKIVDIDGNVYEMVNIGPMRWMKENLRTTRYKAGSVILDLPDNTDWKNTSQGAWSFYDNDPSLDIYGKIYNTRAAQNTAGLCPQGWQVPSIQELTDLTQYGGGTFHISTTPNNEQKVYSKSIFDNSDYIFINPLEQNHGVSCRCMKD
jgi:hypothetical protein